MQHRSISQRLKKTKRLDVKLEILADWFKVWEDGHKALLTDLGAAVARRDFDEQCMIVSELKEDAQKRFDAAQRIVEHFKETILKGTNDNPKDEGNGE